MGLTVGRMDAKGWGLVGGGKGTGGILGPKLLVNQDPNYSLCGLRKLLNMRNYA